MSGQESETPRRLVVAPPMRYIVVAGGLVGGLRQALSDSAVPVFGRWLPAALVFAVCVPTFALGAWRLRRSSLARDWWGDPE